MTDVPKNSDDNWVDYKFLPKILKFIAILLGPIHGAIKFDED